MSRSTNAPAQAFWAKVDRSAGPNACWPFQGGRFANGYGRIKILGVTWLAHRRAHFLVTGELPEAVCHRCDNPPCCNPAHLFSGTQAINQQDRKAKGRSSFGDRNGRSKLNAAGALAIRTRWAAGELQRDLAAEFGLSQPTVSQICTGKSWRHTRPRRSGASAD